MQGGLANFEDPVVGTNKPVTVTGFALVGESAVNYTLEQMTGEAMAKATASILEAASAPDGGQPQEPTPQDSIATTEDVQMDEFDGEMLADMGEFDAAFGDGLDVDEVSSMGEFAFDDLDEGAPLSPLALSESTAIGQPQESFMQVETRAQQTAVDKLGLQPDDAGEALSPKSLQSLLQRVTQRMRAGQVSRSMPGAKP